MIFKKIYISLLYKILNFFLIGHYKYIEDGNEDGIKNNKVQIDSLFDLASCSKVIAGTSAVGIWKTQSYIFCSLKYLSFLFK